MYVFVHMDTTNSEIVVFSYDTVNPPVLYANISSESAGIPELSVVNMLFYTNHGILCDPVNGILVFNTPDFLAKPKQAVTIIRNTKPKAQDRFWDCVVQNWNLTVATNEAFITFTIPSFRLLSSFSYYPAPEKPVKNRESVLIKT